MAGDAGAAGRRGRTTFSRNAHVAYFVRCLRGMPSKAESMDGNRITIAYFCLSALDLLGALNPETEGNGMATDGTETATKPSKVRITRKEMDGWEAWIWSLQHPLGGFRGSTFTIGAQDGAEMSSNDQKASNPYDPPHLPSTYTALLALGLLRSDFRKLDRAGIVRLLADCREEDGSFSPLPRWAQAIRPDLLGDDSTTRCIGGSGASFESDARMAYCAAAISTFLGEPCAAFRAKTGSQAETSGQPSVLAQDTRRSRTLEWIRACQTWEGGFAARPRDGASEAQGGTTYCSVASLEMFSRSSPGAALPHKIANDEQLKSRARRWLVQRQISPVWIPEETRDVLSNTTAAPDPRHIELSEEDANAGEDDDADDDDDLALELGIGGFQGRPGKLADVCYSFWCGAALKILSPGSQPIFDVEANRTALLNAQSPIGGFGKAAGEFPDPFHSYLALAALALIEEERCADDLASPFLGLKSLCPLWNVSKATRTYMEAQTALLHGS